MCEQRSGSKKVLLGFSKTLEANTKMKTIKNMMRKRQPHANRSLLFRLLEDRVESRKALLRLNFTDRKNKESKRKKRASVLMCEN
jgi:hypothetical protein